MVAAGMTPSLQSPLGSGWTQGAAVIVDAAPGGVGLGAVAPGVCLGKVRVPVQQEHAAGGRRQGRVGVGACLGPSALGWVCTVGSQGLQAWIPRGLLLPVQTSWAAVRKWVLV